jgi:uncharacterized protein (DUF433 family)
MFVSVKRNVAVAIIDGNRPDCENAGTGKLSSGEACFMNTHELITSTSDVLGGTPVFAGTRVPVKNLTDYLEAGDTLDEFLDDFPSVTRERAVAVLERAKEVLLASI